MFVYQEALELSERIGDRAAAAVAAFNLGHAYKDLPALRDLAAAEQWYGRSLAMFDEGDRLGRGKCHSQLGLVAYERFQEARAAGAAEAEPLKHLNAALNYYQQALALLPANAVNDLAVTHNQLGLIYKDAGQTPRALEHYQQSIHYKEQQAISTAQGKRATTWRSCCTSRGGCPTPAPTPKPPCATSRSTAPAPPPKSKKPSASCKPSSRPRPRPNPPRHAEVLRSIPLAWAGQPTPSC
ncbi:MAG: tetratricopeptide repeat protein [Chloroflexi bacterium]|nr:tetratricopeptide repeat protein [Chloroflexota bacterium]